MRCDHFFSFKWSCVVVYECKTFCCYARFCFVLIFYFLCSFQSKKSLCVLTRNQNQTNVTNIKTTSSPPHPRHFERRKLSAGDTVVLTNQSLSQKDDAICSSLRALGATTLTERLKCLGNSNQPPNGLPGLHGTEPAWGGYPSSLMDSLGTDPEKELTTCRYLTFPYEAFLPLRHKSH